MFGKLRKQHKVLIMFLTRVVAAAIFIQEPVLWKRSVASTCSSSSSRASSAVVATSRGGTVVSSCMSLLGTEL